MPGTYRYLNLLCQKLMEVIGLSRKNCNIRYISETYTCIHHDIETLRSDDGEGNKNVKTKNMFDKKNNNFARTTHVFVHFSLSELGYGSYEFQLQESSPTFDKVKE